MHPHIIWLYKQMREIRDNAKTELGAIRVNKSHIEKFCEDLPSRDHALAMFSALFEITKSQDQDVGSIIRKIDQEAIRHTHSNKIFRHYDNKINDCLDNGFDNILYDLQMKLREDYRTRVPPLDTNFDELIKESKSMKEAQLFDPSNLF